MSAVKRSLYATKRVDLSSLFDGWDECYAIVTLATYQEVSAFLDDDKRKSGDRDGYFKFQNGVIAKHLVSGKVLTTNQGSKESELVDMVAADSESFIELSNLLFNEIMGFTYDPKGSTKAA